MEISIFVPPLCMKGEQRYNPLADENISHGGRRRDGRRAHRLISNPDCTTAVALMSIYPLHRAFGVRRVFAASYQAVSGSGGRAIEELRHQVQLAAQDRQLTREVYPHPMAFSVLPH